MKSAALKPEFALKRVNDLINSAVGNPDKEKRLALDQLHTIICVKKKNVLTKFYEPLMKRHIELCVDLKDHHTAKDGLHQYRNLCLSSDAASLETIILYLLELSENRAFLAKEKADKVALAAANRVADLDQEESPESIMLSSMTGEGTKERTDREVVIPWLKFLWENFRAVLDLLARIPKLEKVYHKACEKAFKFCTDFSRNLEFRRLCEMLRNHLSNFQKPPVGGRINKSHSNWEWTPESIESHLQTRFAQLEVASSFEVWNEAFRTVEDINSILAVSKKAPKPKLMMTYYEKLTRIFAVADNKLFHAYSCLKLYQSTLEGKKDIRPEEKSLMATAVVLAALSVPSTKDIYASLAVEEEEVTVDKSAQLATLLDFQANASRELLLSEITNVGLLSEILPEFQGLYESLEVKFGPLKLIPSIKTALTAVRNHPILSQYSVSLEKMVMVRVLQQLSRVYNTIKLEFLYKLFGDLSSFSAVGLEKVLLDAVAGKQLYLKISHGNGTISFNVPSSSTISTVDNQVVQLGTGLNKAARVIETVADPALVNTNANARKFYFNLVSEHAEEEFKKHAERKTLIEQRKEQLEHIQRLKLQNEALRLKRLQQQKLQELIAQQEEEEKKRKEELLRIAQEELETARIQAELEKLGVSTTEEALKALPRAERLEKLAEAQAAAQRIKEGENKKLLDAAKKVDHFARACRIFAKSKVVASQATHATRDAALLQEKSVTINEQWKKQHDEDLLEKTRLSRMNSSRAEFERGLLEKQRSTFEKKRAQEIKRLIQEQRDFVVETARIAYSEELARIEEEEERERLEIAKAEQERIERENWEKLRREREEQEERERLEEERIRREKEAAEAKRKALEAERKAAEEAAAAASRPAAYVPPSARSPASGPKMDPYGRPAGGGSESTPAARSTTGGRPDPFDNLKRGSAPQSRADPFDNLRRGDSTSKGGFDSFNRGRKPDDDLPRNDRVKGGWGDDRPPARNPPPNRDQRDQRDNNFGRRPESKSDNNGGSWRRGGDS